MKFHPSKLKLLPPVMAAFALVLSAGAQQGGQPIIFSSPQNPDSSAGTPTLVPQNHDQINLADTLQPSQLFLKTPDDALPMPQQPQVFSPAEQQRMEKLLDDRKNWTLLTPEEIYNLTTPEKMLQTPDNPAAAPEDRTSMERFLDRQDQMRMGNTNADDWRNDNQDSPWNLSHNREANNPLADENNGLENSMQNPDRLQSGVPENNGVSADQNENPALNLLALPQPQQPTAQNAAQLAAMERFRQLLEASSAADSAPTPDGKFFPAPKLAPDPNITPTALINPAGASFTPLSDDIGRPTGLTPLPGIVTPVSHPAAAPSWAPQPAPWLSQIPEAFTIPQRKF
jgi:hypothetical protein